MVLLITGPRWPSLKWSKCDFNDSTKRYYFIINGIPIFTQLKDEASVSTSESNLEVENKRLQLSATLKQADFEREHTTNTSKVVWDSSIVLAKYLENIALRTKIDLKFKRVLELGAGKGVVGMACALLGASVVLSDAPEAIPALKKIVAMNGLFSKSTDLSLQNGHIEKIIALDWLACSQDDYVNDMPKLPFDYIVASDVIWVDWLVEPLIKTLSRLMTPRYTIGFLAYQLRGARCHPLFLKALENCEIIYEVIPFEDLHPCYQLGGAISIYRLEKR